MQTLVRISGKLFRFRRCYSRRVGILFTLVIVLVVSAAILPADELDPDRPAFAVPVSNRVIEGQISFSTGSPFSFKLREGMMLTTRSTAGPAYGFVPLIQKNGDIEFAVYELSEAVVGERAVEIGLFTVSGRGQAPAAAPTAEPIDILVYRVTSSRFPEPPIEDISSVDTEYLREAFQEADTCCVTCNGRRVCACEVDTSCGSCCAPGCCGGGSSPRFEPQL